MDRNHNVGVVLGKQIMISRISWNKINLELSTFLQVLL